jgi:hypothetical protein
MRGRGGEETEKGGVGKEEEVKISWSRSVEEWGREGPLTDLRDFQHPGCCLMVSEEELLCPHTTLQHPGKQVAQHAYDQPTKTVFEILARIFREQKSMSVVNCYVDLIWLCSLLPGNRGRLRRS